MKPAVVITGGAGLLAVNWALAIRKDYAVTLGLHEREISVANVNAARMNLNSVNELVSMFRELQPKLVIHTAGFTSVEECEASPDLAHQINVELADNVAQACAKLGLALIHISTDHLFSGDNSLVDESAITNPKNVYGKTKAKAECRVLEAHPQALVLRTNFYGWGLSYRRSFSDIIIENLRSGSEITLFTDVLYTPILIETLVQVAHQLVGAGISGIVHLVGDDRVSKYDFGVKIAGKFGLDSNLIIPGLLSDQSSLVLRPYDMSLSNQKVTSLLGITLGGVDEQLDKLLRQEELGIAREVQQI